MSFFKRILARLFGIGKRKVQEAARDIFGTYVIERRTSDGQAVRRYDDGSVRIGKRLVREPRD